jgi:hypothetical protein
MWRPRNMSPIETSALALETNAVCAGLALGCAYASSDEYEAEVINARRAAGAYGPRRQRRQALVVFAIMAAAVIVAAMVI